MDQDRQGPHGLAVESGIHADMLQGIIVGHRASVVSRPPSTRQARRLNEIAMTAASSPPLTLHRRSRWRVAALGFVFLWFFLGGIAHFAFTEVEMRIVPPWVPWPRAAVLISGVFELLGAAGLLWRPARRWAGLGLMLLTALVTPAHFYMLERPDLFASIPYWALIVRLPVQVALLVLIWWATQRWDPLPDQRS